MSEAHVLYTGIASVEAVMYAMFQFIDNGGSGRSSSGVRWADNDISHALYDGSSFESDRTQVTGASYFNTSGCYMVIESASTMPSGNRWQCKIRKSGNDLEYDFGPRGGWTYGSNNWGSSPKSGLITWNDGGDPASGSTVLISSCDLDTYGASSTKVEYFRLCVRENSYSDGSQFGRYSIRVGGYIPTDAVNDTNPACVLAGDPDVYTGNYNWGKTGATSYCINCIPPDTNGSETDLSVGQAYGYITSVSTSAQSPGNDGVTFAVTRAGQWVNFPVFLISQSSTATVGYFGKYDMFGLPGTYRTDGDADANTEYIVANSLLLRWNP